MSLRYPGPQTVLDMTDTGTGATSIVSRLFTIPQDTDNIVVKVPVVSVNGSVPVVDIFAQTTDDGGTTFYDMANIRPPTLGTSSVLFVNNTTAMMVSIPVISRSSTVGSAQSSSLGANTVSGIPVLSQQGRILIRYTSGNVVANNGVQVQVKVNSQSASS